MNTEIWAKEENKTENKSKELKSLKGEEKYRILVNKYNIDFHKYADRFDICNAIFYESPKTGF